jgi:hypothetical protein
MKKVAINIYKKIPGEIRTIIAALTTRTIRNTNIPLFNIYRFKSYLNKPLIFKKNPNLKYFTQYYQTKEDNPLLEPVDYKIHKVEILSGEKINKNKKTTIKEDIILPISFEEEGVIRIEYNKQIKELKKFKKKRFFYITFHKDSIVEIISKKPYILGNPIKKNLIDKTKPKLVLYLFVDGLANYFNDKDSLKDYMPNTHHFFSKGLFFNKCHANGEWTLPSVPTFFTGEYTHNHGLFHPRKMLEISPEKNILSEYFKNENFLTCNIGANWRKHPNYGYVKGFDRTIYKSEMDVSEVIVEFIEQINSFSNRNHFIWLDIFNIHNNNYVKNIPHHINNQVNYDYDCHNYLENEEKKSVFASKNISKTKRYYHELKRTDTYLKIIYDLIEQKYSPDEFLVVLCSDHGQAYLAEDKHPLSDNRNQVPLMMRGKNIPNNIITDEYVENIDIMPSVLTLLNIPFDKNIDGQIPKVLGGKKSRAYVYSESIFPEQTFKVIIRSKNHKLLFESGEKVTKDGKIILGNYKTEFIKKNDVKENEKEIIEKYINKIKESIKKLNNKR